MNRRCLIGAAVLALLGTAGANTAGAAPKPAYDITCVVGGQTTVTWRHGRLSQATLEWFAAGAANAYVSTTVPLSPHPPHGFIVTSAGVVSGFTAARVRITFQRAASSVTDHVEAACRNA